jgi:hypothetical protein
MTDPQCQVCDKSVTGPVVVDLAKREIKLNRQRNAQRAAKGAWTQQDHPELDQGAAQWVRDIRQASAKRFDKIEHHQAAEAAQAHSESGLNSSVL